MLDDAFYKEFNAIIDEVLPLGTAPSERAELDRMISKEEIESFHEFMYVLYARAESLRPDAVAQLRRTVPSDYFKTVVTRIGDARRYVHTALVRWEVLLNDYGGLATVAENFVHRRCNTR